VRSNVRTNDFLRLLTQAQEMFPYRCVQLFDRFTGSTDVNSRSLSVGNVTSEICY
jgi:hypothetical protein